MYGTSHAANTGHAVSDVVPAGALDACLALVRAEAGLRKRMDSTLSATHGLSLNDLVILRLLQKTAGHRLRRVDLAAGLGITSSAVTRLLLSLERTGLVGREPHPTDARAAHATLTEAGLERATDAGATAAAVATDLIGGRLNTQEVATLLRLLTKLADVLLP